jgi:hypothetical protein
MPKKSLDELLSAAFAAGAEKVEVHVCRFSDKESGFVAPLSYMACVYLRDVKMPQGSAIFAKPIGTLCTALSRFVDGKPPVAVKDGDAVEAGPPVELFEEAEEEDDGLDMV